MLNIKKITALAFVALVTLACLTAARVRQEKMLCETDSAEASECLQKGNSFSIVNIFSLQFR